MKRIAVLDLGSQTFRMVVAECSASIIQILTTMRENCRLGEGLAETGMISSNAFERCIKTLYDFHAALERYGTVQTRAVATAALRNAVNADSFLREALKAGFHIEVIDGRAEAALAARGMSAAIGAGPDEHFVALDVGGGSTEVMLCRGCEVLLVESFRFGAVSMTERFVKAGIEQENPFAAIHEYVMEQAGRSSCVRQMLQTGAEIMAASGGTATTAGAIYLGLEQYSPEAVRGLDLHADQLFEMACRLNSMLPEQKRMVKGLEPDRSDVIEAGIIIMHTVMNFTGFDTIKISDGGLLTGLLLTEIEKETNCHAESSRTGSLYL